MAPSHRGEQGSEGRFIQRVKTIEVPVRAERRSFLPLHAFHELKEGGMAASRKDGDGSPMMSLEPGQGRL